MGSRMSRFDRFAPVFALVYASSVWIVALGLAIADLVR